MRSEQGRQRIPCRPWAAAPTPRWALLSCSRYISCTQLFDIIWDHFSGVSPPYTAPHAPCGILYLPPPARAYWMLVGACYPMLRPIHVTMQARQDGLGAAHQAAPRQHQSCGVHWHTRYHLTRPAPFFTPPLSGITAPVHVRYSTAYNWDLGSGETVACYLV